MKNNETHKTKAKPQWGLMAAITAAVAASIKRQGKERDKGKDEAIFLKLCTPHVHIRCPIQGLLFQFCIALQSLRLGHRQLRGHKTRMLAKVWYYVNRG